jgi:hypothetical protein
LFKERKTAIKKQLILNEILAKADEVSLNIHLTTQELTDIKERESWYYRISLNKLGVAHAVLE